MKCIFEDCPNDARNNIGVRLRSSPKKNAVWAQDTQANLCDEHARKGLRITMLIESIDGLSVETHAAVLGGKDQIRKTVIKKEKLPK